jgi:MFS family permease
MRSQAATACYHEAASRTMPDSTRAAGPSPASPGAGADTGRPSAPTPGRPLHRLAAALTYPEFRNLWIGACTSSIGTWMQSVAQNWLVFTLTNSAFYLGLDAFLGQLPIMLFTLIGGVVADRRDRRRVLLASQYIQMTSAFTLALLVYLQVVRPAPALSTSLGAVVSLSNHAPVGQAVSMTVWFVLALSFLTGCAQAFGGPAYQSLIPSLVEKKDLPNAIALNSVQFNLARVIGPLLAAAALASYGSVFCFAVNGLSFLAVIAALAALTVPSRQLLPAQPMLAELGGGLSYVRHEGPLFGLTIVAFVTTFLAMPLLTLLPVFVQKVFHLGVAEYGRMMAFQGAGAVVGALVVAWLGRFSRMGSVALMVQIGLGAVIAAFALSSNPTLSYALLFMAGIAQLIVFSLAISLVQLVVPNEMRGRVMSIYMMAFRSGMPLGSLTAGVLANRFSAPTVLAVNGVLLMAFGGIVLATYRKIRTV